MPLSDNEQRLLQQMEQALYAEDPKFAEGLRKPRAAKMERGRFLLGVGSVVVGLLILVAGVATQLIPVGVLGFLAMIAGSFVAYGAWSGNLEESVESDGSGEDGEDPTRLRGPAPSGDSSDGFMEKMEDRWRRRKEQGGSF